MLLIICTKYEKNPSWTVDATDLERTQDAGRMAGRTEWNQYNPPNNFVVWGYNDALLLIVAMFIPAKTSYNPVSKQPKLIIQSWSDTLDMTWHLL